MISRKRIVELARKLHRNSTPAEKLLWEELRNRQLNGVKILRQHPLIYEEDRGHFHFFIADIYCAQYKLVIELDGKIHDKQKHYDRERDLIIDQMGLKVIRFKNEETDSMDKLVKKITSHF